MILSILFLALAAPLIWELWNDRKGEPKSDKREDVQTRIWLAFMGTLVIGLYLRYIEREKLDYMTFILSGSALSLSIHFLLFDYLINIILKKPDWFSYLGKTSAVDQWQPWVKIGPWGRLAVRVSVLSLSAFW